MMRLCALAGFLASRLPLAAAPPRPHPRSRSSPAVSSIRRACWRCPPNAARSTVAGESRRARRPQDRAVRRARAGHQPQQGAGSAVPDRRRSGHFGGGSVHLVRAAVRSRAPRSRHHPARPARHRPFASPRLRLRRPESVRAHSTKSRSGRENIKCRDELSKKSDLRQYTTSVAVRDLDAVRARARIRAHQSATAAPTARAWRSTMRAVIRSPRAR